MALDILSLVNAIVLLLSVTLVALAASVIKLYNKRFSEGEVKDLGHYVFFAMAALLLKLLVDFSILVLPFFLLDSVALIQVLGIFGIVSIILTAVFLIKVSLLIRRLSETFGFEMK